MKEDWRLALDKNYVVGVVFADFRKAFDAISIPSSFSKTFKDLVQLGTFDAGLKTIYTTEHK